MKTVRESRAHLSAEVTGAFIVTAMLGAPSAALAAPSRADVIGEVTELKLDNASDPYSGGTVVIAGQRIILPRNLLIDLPANMMSLSALFGEAPSGCAPASGLARADPCLEGRPGAIATIVANRTNGGNVIAGEVHLVKGTELLSGVVTYIDYDHGFFRLDGALGSPAAGLMVRLNDPSARHSIQSGPGCGSSPNCSADERFNLDPDNFTVTTTNGYPVCLPSTVTSLARIHPADAAGAGDAFCPSTNRAGLTAADSTRFAPLLVGDNVTVTGNQEVISGVEFLSINSLVVNTALVTQNTATQPDFVKAEEVTWDAPGFNNIRARLLLIGASTIPSAQVDIFSVHRSAADNSAHEVPLGSTVNNNVIAGIGPNAGLLFKIRYDVDFVAGANPGLSPCTNLGLAGFSCAGSGLAAEFSVLSPIAREVMFRTRHHAALAAGVVVRDVSGNVAPDGVYLTPLSPDYPTFMEIDLARVSAPYNFEGIPWMADRRLSPGGCAEGGCEPDPQPLVPFPFSGLNPTNQVAVPAPQRVLARYPFGAGDLFPFPPADPSSILLSPVDAIESLCSSPPSGAPVLGSVSPSSIAAGSSAVVTLLGSNFTVGAACDFGFGVVAACNVNSPTKATAVLVVDPSTSPGARDVTLQNPSSAPSILAGSLTVTPPAPPPPPPPPSLFFADTFNRLGPLGSQWIVLNGTFLLNNQFAQGNASRDQAMVAALNVADLKVVAVLTPPSTGTAGVRLRQKSASGGTSYAAYVASTGITVRRQIAGVEADIATLPFALPAGAHTLAAKVTGASPVTIAIELDGAAVLTTFDSSASRITAAGGVALEGASGSRWDDLKVFSAN